MRCIAIASTLIGLTCWPALGRAAEPPASRTQQLEEAAHAVTSTKYLLRYKFAPREVISWKVQHLATTDTTIKGNSQTSRSRSASTKVWKVMQVDAEGNITFQYSVSDVDMWQKISDRPEVRYNSREDAPPPREYAQVATTVGKPLATVTISPNGTIREREGSQRPWNMGLGLITLPLPLEPIAVGSQWHIPHEVEVRLADGEIKRIKTRLRYQLEKVQAGVATIAVRTEVITPVNDPKVQVQLMQEVTNGTIKFDIDAGRVLSQQTDWDETVVGFSGAESRMKYLARFTEELLPADAAQAQAESSVKR